MIYLTPTFANTSAELSTIYPASQDFQTEGTDQEGDGERRFKNRRIPDGSLSADTWQPRPASRAFVAATVRR